MKYIWTGHMCVVAAYGVCGKETWTLLLSTLHCNSKLLVWPHNNNSMFSIKHTFFYCSDIISSLLILLLNPLCQVGLFHNIYVHYIYVFVLYVESGNQH